MTETLEVTYPGPACSPEAIAESERVKLGEHVCFLARLEVGLVRGDQHLPRAIADQLLATGMVKRTNPPPKPKPPAHVAPVVAPIKAQE